MAELLRTVMALYAGRILVRNIQIEMKFSATRRTTVLEGEIRQVINNLVRNALDAMSHGGGGDDTPPSPEGQAQRHSGSQVDRSRQRGKVVKPEMQEHLFEAFQTTKELTGTGLGLWVSKGIVEKHGGQIRAKTRPWARAWDRRFSVWLPVDSGSSLAAQAD